MRKGLVLLVSLMCVLALAGCGKDNKKQAMLTGSFTAQVRGVIPDYVMDEKPRIAIVTEFHGFPFLIHVGTEIGSQLVEGEIYVFTFEPMPVNYSKEDLDSVSLKAMNEKSRGFVITDFRLANEDEIGLSSLRPTIE